MYVPLTTYHAYIYLGDTDCSPKFVTFGLDCSPTIYNECMHFLAHVVFPSYLKLATLWMRTPFPKTLIDLSWARGWERDPPRSNMTYETESGQTLSRIVCVVGLINKQILPYTLWLMKDRNVYMDSLVMRIIREASTIVIEGWRLL